MRPEALKSEQKEIFDKLNKFPQFYLGGGTALALQIGHRISVDFDFFSEQEITLDLLPKIEEVFSGYKRDVLVNDSEQLTVLLNKIKITFIRYPFPMILPAVKFEGVNFFDIKEIAAAKAYAIGRRATYKDYVDLYFILAEKHSTLKEIKSIAEKKYKDDFNFKLFLEQLIYLEDIDDQNIQFIKKPVGKEKISGFLREEVKKIKISNNAGNT